jgi:outer membrane protein OmpA-like peptidoglycan-associated protein
MNRFKSGLAAIALAALATPSAATATDGFVRPDGIVFDSDLGAACGLLRTDLHFDPWSAQIETQNQLLLDLVADCLNYGTLARARVAVIGLADDDFLYPAGEVLARERMNAVRLALLERGVDARQLEPWALSVDWEAGEKKPDRVVFRVLEGGPRWMVLL